MKELRFVFVIFLAFCYGETSFLQTAFMDIVKALAQRNHEITVVVDENITSEMETI